MQQTADTPALVMQTKREGTVQIGNHEQGFGRDMKSVRRDRDFREICCQCGPLNGLRDAARNREFSLPSESRFGRLKMRFRGPLREPPGGCNDPSVISSCFPVIGALWCTGRIVEACIGMT